MKIITIFLIFALTMIGFLAFSLDKATIRIDSLEKIQLILIENIRNMKDIKAEGK